MNNDLKDILSNSNKDIDNQQLLAYLSDQLSKSNMHEVEKTMAEDAFMNDAIEGLQQIDSKKNIPVWCGLFRPPSFVFLSCAEYC